jgi:hypothetical protein
MDIINVKSFKDTVQSTVELTYLDFTNQSSKDFDCGAATIVGLLPSTTFVEGNISIHWSIDGESFFPPIYNGNPAHVISCSPDKVSIINPMDLVAYRYARFIVAANSTFGLGVITRRVF